MNKEKYMLIALSEAEKANLKNEVPIGAVIIKKGQVIAKAHNLRENKKNSLYHAEILAIDKACKKLKNFRLEDCELYVTVEPCIMCAGAIIQSRIKKIYFGAKDEKYGAVCSQGEVFSMPSNHKVEYEGEVLEKECSQMIKDFFKRLRNKK